MKKRLIVIAAVALICIFAAGGTIAWLTASASLNNTFTVGSIEITLAEPEWVQNSKIYPGAVIDKDPTVTVTAGSEDCYVYALVDNQLNGQIAGAASLNISPDWVFINSNGTKTVYRYKDEVEEGTMDQTLPPVFTAVSVSTTAVTKANIALLNGKSVVVNAFAHQSKAISQADADKAALVHFEVL